MFSHLSINDLSQLYNYGIENIRSIGRALEMYEGFQRNSERVEKELKMKGYPGPVIKTELEKYRNEFLSKLHKEARLGNVAIVDVFSEGAYTPVTAQPILKFPLGGLSFPFLQK